MTAPLWRLPAVELAGRYRRGEATPVDCLEQALARIERLNPALNAVVALAADAREAARASAARYRAGTPKGPLDGVPVAVKDNILVRGMPTTWGTRAWRDRPTAEDELPVKRLRDAGALVVAKTNVPEFTLEGYTGNALFGATRNPWDPRLTPGGSSGGSVAGVAAGLFPLALGTDGGGSIRRPASHTGLVGFKPSIGAVPRYPTLPQILLDFEVIGPIARTVADAALLFEAIRGPDPLDRPSPEGPPDAVTLDLPPRLRIRYVARFGDHALDPQIEASVAAAAQVLRRLGHEVTDAPLPFDLAPITDFWPLLGQVGLAYLFAGDRELEPLAQPKFAAQADAGRRVPASRYLEGIEAVRLFRRAVAAAFGAFDVLMTPAAAALPWPAEQTHPPTIAGREVAPRGHAVYTGWVNACGHPAVALPCDPAAEGLPIGFQLVAGFGRDTLLLRLAAQYEAAARFAERWPALAVQG